MPSHQVDYARKLRAAVLAFLGGRCVQCGFADGRALQVDHINGGGRQDRLKYGTSPAGYYRHILKDTTSKYQLLCANCNWIKRVEKQEYRPRGKEEFDGNHNIRGRDKEGGK